ncbi:MAG: hypothetical protein IKT60_03585 [Clostridia bacterium]|nr:hypothetical protein [Clostridia bacterium]
MAPFDIDSIAGLARLTVSDGEKAALAEDMAAILAFAATLPEADPYTEEAALPLSALREDEAADSDPAPLLCAAPKLREDAFTVPSGGISL